MNSTIWENLADTSWWIYLALIIMVRVALNATKARVVPIRSTLLVPVIFISCSLINISFMQHLSLMHAAWWLGGLAGGALFGWLQFPFLKIKVVKDEEKLYIPGTWTIFIVIMLVFTAKLYTGYQLALDPSKLTIRYAPYILAFYGAVTGLFLSRLLQIFRCLRNGPFINLQATLT